MAPPGAGSSPVQVKGVLLGSSPDQVKGVPLGPGESCVHLTFKPGSRPGRPDRELYSCSCWKPNQNLFQEHPFPEECAGLEWPHRRLLVGGLAQGRPPWGGGAGKGVPVINQPSFCLAASVHSSTQP